MKKIIASSDYPGFKVLVRAVREDKGTFAGEVLENVFQKSGIEYKVGENVGGLRYFAFTFTVVDNVHGREIKTPVTFEKVVEMFKEINLGPVKRIVRKIEDLNGLENGMGLRILVCDASDTEDYKDISVSVYRDKWSVADIKGPIKNKLKDLKAMGFDFELELNSCVRLFGNEICLDNLEEAKIKIKEVFEEKRLGYREYLETYKQEKFNFLRNTKFENIIKEILEEKEKEILDEIRRNGKPFSNEHDFIIHWTKKYGWSAITLGTEVIAGNCYLREDIANEYVEKLNNL